MVQTFTDRQVMSVLSTLAASLSQATANLAQASNALAEVFTTLAASTPTTLKTNDVTPRAAVQPPSLKTAPALQSDITRALATLEDGHGATVEEMAEMLGKPVDEFKIQSRVAGKRAEKHGNGIAGVFYEPKWTIADDGRRIRVYEITAAGRAAVETENA